MSDSIQQSFGLDASQALEALNQLDSAFARFAATTKDSAASFKSFNASAAKTVSALGGLGSSSASTASSVAASNSRLASSFQQTSAQSQASIGRMTTSMQLLSRIVFTQGVISGLRILRSTFHDATQSAVDFQRQIALVQTIDQSGQSFEQLAASVRKVSDSLNIDLLETAAGLYQTISNQVGDATQSVEFLTEAGKFAKATNSSLTSSVDLLSGALKSYGLGVEDTNKVSSLFFRTIDLGRVDAQSLGNTMGRILPISSQLGISLEETNAAIAAISVKGLDARQSLTQISGIMTALLKPTKEMKAAYADLGFSSAEAAIKTLGFAGLLDALAKRSGGSTIEMAKLFVNVRGLGGATSLTSDNVKALSANIGEMQSAMRNLNDEKFLQATATDAEKATREVNKLKNAFTVELGQAVLASTVDLSEFVGGADSVTGAVKAAGPALIGLVGSLTLLKSGFAGAAAEAFGLSNTMGRLIALLPAAIGFGKTLGSLFDEMRSKSTLAPLNSLEKANQEGLDKFKSQLNEARDAGNKADQERLQEALQFTRGLNQTYLKQQADLQASQKIIDKLQSKKTLTTTQAIQLQQARQTVRNTPSPLAGVRGVDQLSAITGQGITTPDELSRGLIVAEKRAEELRAKLAEALTVKPQAENLKTEINSIFDQIGQRANARQSVGSINAPALNSQFENTLTLFKEVTKDGKATEGELNVLIDLTNKFRENAVGGSALSADRLTQRLGFSSSIELLDQALSKMQALQKLPTADIGPISAELQQIQSVLGLFAPAATAMERGAAASAQTAANYERAAAAAQQLNARPPTAQALGGLIKGYSEGGYVHLAAGGFAKGTDTVPAMLTKGEMVINAQSTRRFLPQLQAINAGVAPSFRGGDTTNISVGDIQVIADPNPKVTAREVVESIRREQRRGTVRQL